MAKGKTFAKPEALSDAVTHYCPGCTHGIAHRIVAEVIEELCRQSGAELVQTIGKIAIVMRRAKQPNPKLSNLSR